MGIATGNYYNLHIAQYTKIADPTTQNSRTGHPTANMQERCVNAVYKDWLQPADLASQKVSCKGICFAVVFAGAS